MTVPGLIECIATDYAESQKVGAHKQALGDTHLYSKQY